jgi:hypothetical protein
MGARAQEGQDLPGEAVGFRGSPRNECPTSASVLGKRRRAPVGALSRRLLGFAQEPDAQDFRPISLASLFVGANSSPDSIRAGLAFSLSSAAWAVAISCLAGWKSTLRRSTCGSRCETVPRRSHASSPIGRQETGSRARRRDDGLISPGGAGRRRLGRVRPARGAGRVHPSSGALGALRSLPGRNSSSQPGNFPGALFAHGGRREARWQ